MSRQVSHVIVTIPALDEATTIDACIGSVARAASALHRHVAVDVVVAVDAQSIDGTAEHAARSLRSTTIVDGCVVEERFGAVGAARRRGTAVGLALARSAPDQTWLATTDADTVVALDWLERQLELAARGITAVAGVVDLHGAEPSLAQRFHRHYHVRADGTHAHVHGANLGVRADLYLAAGGWRDQATGEDHDLWRRVRELAPVVQTTAVRVATSARLEGRAPDGFAADLRRLESTA
jgi:hypothetical protein